MSWLLLQNIQDRIISNKRNDSLTSPKTYCSIPKSFLINKKIPCIPPIFNENSLITDFKQKAQPFNFFLWNSAHWLTWTVKFHLA